MRYYCVKKEKVIPLIKSYKVCVPRDCPYKVLMEISYRKFNRHLKGDKNAIYKYIQTTQAVGKCDCEGI